MIDSRFALPISGKSWPGGRFVPSAAGVVVPVYYLSADPTVSDVTADPRRSLRRRAIIVAGFGLAALLSVAGVFVAFNASRRSRNA